MSESKIISKSEIARRLTIARKIAGKTQEMAAEILAVSRPTIVSIENGTRTVRTKEIELLANFYETSVNQLLRYEAIHTDLIPRFRRLTETEDSDTDRAVQILNNLISADVELENLIGINPKFNYPSGRNIQEGNIIQLADQHALNLRETLGYGINPISDIFSLIENDLGIRLYQCKLKSEISGLYAFDNELGACILLNSSHPRPRRVMSAAHELAHFIGNREDLEILDVYETKNSRDERYANRFSRTFLMPERSFVESYEDLTAGSSKLTREIVIRLAAKFHVSNQACVMRLEELNIVRKGTWNWFADNKGITKQDELKVLGETAYKMRCDSQELTKFSIPYRLCIKAYAVWKREIMSEGQLSSLLQLGRIELREILDNIEIEAKDIDDMFKN